MRLGTKSEFRRNLPKGYIRVANLFTNKFGFPLLHSGIWTLIKAFLKLTVKRTF